MTDLDQLESALWRLITAVEDLTSQLRAREQIDYQEFLTAEELTILCGKRASKQIEWLNSHRWKYELNAAGKPVVGRFYARQRLGGAKSPTNPPAASQWVLDPSKVK